MEKWLIVVGVAAATVLATPWPAHSDPGCTHRNPAHYERHGGLRADSDYHAAHGDLPTCRPDDRRGSERRDDADEAWHWRHHDSWHFGWRDLF